MSALELSRADLAAEGASPELVTALLERAGDRAQTLSVEATAPWRDARNEAFALGAVLGLTLLVAAAFPHRLWSGFLALVAPGNVDAALLQADPIAGDLTLTYRYPAHTGLATRTETGVSGDLRAPRGTFVDFTARADRDVSQAIAIVCEKNTPLVVHGRALSGTLFVDTGGTWRLRYLNGSGRVIAEGPPRTVTVDPDLPPTAEIEKPAREVEVDPRGSVQLVYKASDDYGLSDLQLVWKNVLGGVEQRKPLPRPSGTVAWELSPLGMKPGDKVAYFLEATDNDAVSGPKKGVSETHVLKVYSAAEHHKEALVRAQALWERLVGVAADRVEEIAPPSTNAETTTWLAHGNVLDRGALSLAGDMRTAAAELKKDKSVPKGLSHALDNVAAGIGNAAQRTQVARAPIAGTAGGARSRTFLAAREAEAREDEKDVLYLEDFFDHVRVEDLLEMAKGLRAERRELTALAEKLRTEKDPAAQKAALDEVQRLKTRIRDLMDQMAALAHGIQDEHLNEEALAELSKDKDMIGKLDDIQKMLAKGDVDKALKELDKLGQQMDELEKSLAARTGEPLNEKYRAQAEKMERLKDELTALQTEESQLRDRTREVRQGAAAEQEKRVAKLGADFVEKLRKKVTEAQHAAAGVDRQVAEQLGVDEDRGALTERLDSLDRALAAKDFDAALDETSRALQAAGPLSARLNAEAALAGKRQSFFRSLPPEQITKSADHAGHVPPRLTEIQEALQKLMPQPGDQTPEQRGKLGELSSKQGALRRRMEEARREMDEVGKEAPIFTPGHGQLLQEAQNAMGNAEGQLRGADARGGQSSEEEALRKLGKFQQAMEEQAKNSTRGKGGFPMPWGAPRGEGSGDDGEDGDSTEHERVEIPQAESQAPAEYRKDILDAARQPAPEKFKDRVKRYYEELVK